MKKTLTFQNQPVIELSDDRNQILISPEHGARVLRWVHDGREVITWPEGADWSRVLKVRGGNPVLFPFIARHFVDGKNELWRDEAGVVRTMPQHGFCRDAAFAVIDEPGDVLRMRITDSEATRGFYPFAFQFDVVVELLPGSRLEIRFETTNTGEGTLPCQAGHHFYFALPHGERADWTLEIPCASWGRQTPDGAILHEPALTDVLNLGDAEPIDRFQIKPTGPRLTLRNTRNERQLVFELDRPGSVPWYAVTTWTEKADSDFYCVEPWTGLPNAIHHGEGLSRLAPGAKEVASCVLDASGW